jgi:hypothetical protein
MTELVTERPELLLKNNILTENICSLIHAQNEEIISFLLIMLEDKNKTLYGRTI